MSETSEVVRSLLKLQCIFLFEKEMNSLKSQKLLKEIDDYVKTTRPVNIRKILLLIVKNFTERFFDDVKEQLKSVMQNSSLSNKDTFMKGTNILNQCLTILEKRMFENLYEKLAKEPIYFLMIFNKFDFDYIKKEERFCIEKDNYGFNVTLGEGISEDRSVRVTSVNIFELVKYIYYNAVINAKKVISKRIFTNFIEENVFDDWKQGKYKKDSCEKFKKRSPKHDTTKDADKDDDNMQEKLRVAEYLIKQIWDYVPNLKNKFVLKSEEFSHQLESLLGENDETYNCVTDDDDDLESEGEKGNWNYVITQEGDTMYMSAPTFHTIGEFLPVLPKPLQKLSLSQQDEPVRKPGITQHKTDIFDKMLENLLLQSKKFVLKDALRSPKTSKHERISSYFKIRDKSKKKDDLKRTMWERFNKKFFAFTEEDAEEEKDKCSYPIRPQEMYDLIPTYIKGKVKPIVLEMNETRYLCAACGFFIESGTGLEALGHKWHDTHFKCRICCERFTGPDEFMLYKGVVLCKYDAHIIFDSVETKCDVY